MPGAAPTVAGHHAASARIAAAKADRRAARAGPGAATPVSNPP